MQPPHIRWQARLGVIAALTVLSLSFGRLVAHSQFPGAHGGALEVGRPAPTFALRATDGRTFDLAAMSRQVVVLAYTSQRCPISSAYAARFHRLVASYANDPRVQFIEINADVASGQLSPEQVREGARQLALRHGLVIDPDGAFARAYGAELTPSFYVIDVGGILRYSGSLDDSRDERAATHGYLADAVRCVLDGIPLTCTSTSPIGCRVPRPVGPLAMR